MRIACLLVPDLPLHAELRASPALRDRPLAITSGPGARAGIVAVSREARAYGVAVGQTLPQARAVCPGIEVRIASPALERSARDTLLDVALSLAPRAELAERGAGAFLSEGTVFVDARGLEALHGGDPRGSEAAFASRLHARAERAGLRGFVALASTREVARLAARHLALAALRGGPDDEEELETTLVLDPERELAFLEPLPIDLLDPDDRTAQALTRFGIHRIRQLLRLPRRELATRLGPGLLELVARARGEATEPPLPEPHTTTLEERIDLEAPIASLEPLRFVLHGLLSRLVERLALRGLGCSELHLQLQLEDGGHPSRRLGLESPCQDARVLGRLLGLAIERDPPAAAVEGLVLACEGVPLAREQLDLFLPRGPSPSALDQTLAELAAICGPDRVGAPQPVDDHRPDAFGLRPFRRSRARARAPDRPGAPRLRPPRRGASLTMRALRPPLHADVRLERSRPAHLRSPLCRGRLVVVSGPWRTTGYWWSSTAHFAVDHYDVQLEDGTLLRLRHDWKARRWQIDGLYD